MKLKTFLITVLSEYCGYVYIVSANNEDEAKQVFNQYTESEDECKINELKNVFSEGEPKIILEKNIYSY